MGYGDYVASDDVRHSGNPFSSSLLTDVPQRSQPYSKPSPKHPTPSLPNLLPPNHPHPTPKTQFAKKTQQIDVKIAEKEARIHEYEQDINKLRGLVRLLKHITNVPTPRSSFCRMHACDITAYITHHGPDIAPQRGRGYVEVLYALPLHLMM